MNKCRDVVTVFYIVMNDNYDHVCLLNQNVAPILLLTL